MFLISSISTLYLLGEVKFIPNSVLTNLFVWQMATLGLLLVILFTLINGKRQRSKIRQFMERRTQTIISQKEKIEEQKALIEYEHEKSDELLKDIFPTKIIKILKNKGIIKPDYYPEASILFADVVSFSKITPHIDAEELVNRLTIYFRAFDKVITENKLILIKTIGDSYFAVGGVPKKSRKNPIYSVLSGLQMQKAVRFINQIDEDGWKIRIGINTGEVVAGVLNTKRPMFDVWGSSVNVASRVQEAGEAGKVNISESTYKKIYPYFECEERGEINTKNVGKIPMYFAKRIKKSLSADEEGCVPNKNFWRYVTNLKDSKPDYLGVTNEVLTMLKEKLPKGIYYHTHNHALNIMNAVEFLGFGEEIFTEDILLLKTAALFHDLGFIDKYQDNEKIGASYARKILPNYGFSDEQIKKVERLILATIFDSEPTDILEEIIKDADLDYLGRDDFEDISKKLMREYLENNIVKSKKEFLKNQVEFLKSHMFLTDTAKSSRIEKKKKNIEIAIKLYNAEA